MLSRRQFLKVAVSAVALSTGYSIYEAKALEVTEINLPLGVGMKVVHITDTHFSSSIFSSEAILRVVASLSPQLIFHTGDLVTYRRGLREAAGFLASLRRIAPVYLVPGNHDHWSGVGDKLKRELGSRGIVVLLNEAVHLGDIAIIGVDDPYTGRASLNQAMHGTSDAAVKLLLAHSPEIIGSATGRVDVVLAGHTHGGQVRFPGVGALWIPLPRKYRRFDYGLFRIGKVRMFVSRGLGTAFLPVRLNCPPEIVVVNL